MIRMAYKLYMRSQVLVCSEEGQDLVEYALVVAFIAFATGLNGAFKGVSSTLGNYIS